MCIRDRLETAEKNYPLETEVKGIHQNSFTFELEDRYPKVTEKDIEMLRFIVDNAYLYKNASSGGSRYNYQNIILEEAGAFFQGAKTAEETAEIIQNRMSPVSYTHLDQTVDGLAAQL